MYPYVSDSKEFRARDAVLVGTAAGLAASIGELLYYTVSRDTTKYNHIAGEISVSQSHTGQLQALEHQAQAAHEPGAVQFLAGKVVNQEANTQALVSEQKHYGDANLGEMGGIVGGTVTAGVLLAVLARGAYRKFTQRQQLTPSAENGS